MVTNIYAPKIWYNQLWGMSKSTVQTIKRNARKLMLRRMSEKEGMNILRGLSEKYDTNIYEGYPEK